MDCNKLFWLGLAMRGLWQTTNMLGKTAAARLVDTILPHRCLSCRMTVGKGYPAGLCADCWQKIHFLTSPLCYCCGRPFETGPSIERQELCLSCLAHPPAFDQARAVFAYTDTSRDLILALKHGDALHGVPIFGHWLARAGAEFLRGADIIAPVPLHPWRLFVRRYNQAALLALAVKHAISSPTPRYVPQLLRRNRATPSLGHLKPEIRYRHLHKAITVTQPSLVKDKHILLIDDVMTSGSTFAECSRALRIAGAAKINVLSLARVLRSE